jgi:recombination protein RecT
MTTNIKVLEDGLRPLYPRFEEALAGAMPVERLIQTVLVSAEQNPAILEANRQTLFNAAMGACLLRLPVDGVTGQAYLVPYNSRVQLISGYRGLITLAARSTFSVHNDIVRERDEFAFTSGSNPHILHSPRGTTVKERGRAIGAYAIFRSRFFPDIVQWLPIEEIMEQSTGRNVWKSNPLAMVLKTPIRRGARLVPHDIAPDLHLAVGLEEAHDSGRHAEITPERSLKVDDAVIVEQQPPKLTERLSEAPKARFEAILPDGSSVACQTTREFADTILAAADETSDRRDLWASNQEVLKRVRISDPAAADRIDVAFS